MNQLGFPLLSVVIFLPLAGAILTLFLPRHRDGWVKAWALIVSLVTFLLSLPFYFAFRGGTAGMQFVDTAPWIDSLGITYRVGLDGISLWLILLTTFLTPLAILSSWSAIRERLKEYMGFMLLLETGMIGVFAAVDLILFYVFWEAMLVPMYFLIGIWGGPRRVYATLKFVLFTMAGSVLMLLAMVALYLLHGQTTGNYTFDLVTMLKTPLPAEAQPFLFLAFALAFAIKVPVFPFHTWLPDAHVEAPTAGSVLLAGILLKMGVYGYLRFALPLFPQAAHQFAPLLSILAIIGIIYGALVAMVQPDIKKLVAYSSVSHLGFVMLGLFAFNQQGISGALVQSVNHGLSTGALFLLVGMIYERTHTRQIADYSNLARRMPVFAAFFLFIALSSIGLPGLNGFVGEFTILVGAFRVTPLYAVLGAVGVILSAWYLLGAYGRMAHAPASIAAAEAAGHDSHSVKQALSSSLPDLTWREIITLVPIALLCLLIGLYPAPLFDTLSASVTSLVELLR